MKKYNCKLDAKKWWHSWFVQMLLQPVYTREYISKNYKTEFSYRLPK